MDQGGKNGRSTAFTVIIIMTFIGSLSGAVAMVIKGFITWFNEIKLKEILREKNFEMENCVDKIPTGPTSLQ